MTSSVQAFHATAFRTDINGLRAWAVVAGNQFSVVAWRPNMLARQVTGQVTGQVTEPIQRLLGVMVAEHSRSELQHLLALRHRDNFIAAYVQPALDGGWIEMTIPQKPTSRLQKYRLTPAGQALLENKNA